MKTDDELKKENPDLYKVAREGGTEPAFSGKYYKHDEKGMYKCAVCENPLFPSTAKFHSDLAGLAGWPSFDEAIPGAVEFKEDNTYGMHRTEVVCAKCKSHLGHIFDDPEAKTGKHFCLNSVCLDFKKE
ncbi:MAG: peptide-methionine (R)-S-oxide reductase MsrB [Patescibacteria group bacterium]